MKESTPLKRNQAIVSFSKEHHFGLLLVWKIRQGLKNEIALERISNYILFFFKEDLEHHFKDEETLLFIKLPVDDLLRKQAQEDHEIIRQMITSIKKHKNELSIIKLFADKLEQHIRFEERKLFVHIQKNISPIVLSDISNRLPSNSSEMDKKWNDNFWT